MANNRYSIETYERVLFLRRTMHWGAERITAKLKEEGRLATVHAVRKWIYRGARPFDLSIITPILPQPAELTPVKAYLLGVLCGDGFISTGYRIGLQVCDKDFANEFSRCIYETYRIPVSLSERHRKSTNYCQHPSVQYVVSAVSKSAVLDLLQYSDFKTKTWQIPRIVKQSGPGIQAAFVRGIADSEGHVRFRKGNSEINICSGNGEALKELQKIFQETFGICPLAMTNGSSVQVIVLTRYVDLLTFKNNIGFNVARKNQALDNALASYKRKGLQKHSDEVKKKALDMLRRGYSCYETGKVLSISPANIYDWKKGRV